MSGKMSMAEIQGRETHEKLAKRTLAFVKVDGNGDCQEVYEVSYHDNKDMEAFKKQASIHKAQMDALEAQKEKERAETLQKVVDGYNAFKKRFSVVSAYSLWEVSVMKSGEYPNDYDKVVAWFSDYLDGKTNEIYDNASLKAIIEKVGK